jgi:hypothetical protein
MTRVLDCRKWQGERIRAHREREEYSVDLDQVAALELNASSRCGTLRVPFALSQVVFVEQLAECRERLFSVTEPVI